MSKTKTTESELLLAFYRSAGSPLTKRVTNGLFNVRYKSLPPLTDEGDKEFLKLMDKATSLQADLEELQTVGGKNIIKSLLTDSKSGRFGYKELFNLYYDCIEKIRTTTEEEMGRPMFLKGDIREELLNMAVEEIIDVIYDAVYDVEVKEEDYNEPENV